MFGRLEGILNGDTESTHMVLIGRRLLHLLLSKVCFLGIEVSAFPVFVQELRLLLADKVVPSSHSVVDYF